MIPPCKAAIYVAEAGGFLEKRPPELLFVDWHPESVMATRSEETIMPCERSIIQPNQN
jgi:hypothetical protein